MAHRPKVLLAKSFIDSHDRAIKTIALTLRDAGMEVVLIDYEVPDDIVRTAIDEDVDVIGVSFMSGGQVQVTSDLMAQMSAQGLESTPVVVGGAIRPFDLEGLAAAGVRSVFRGGEQLSTIAETFRELSVESAGSRS